MFLKMFILSFCLMSFSFAQVGEILSLKGNQDAFLTRGSEKIMLSTGTLLEVGDQIHTEHSHVVLVLYPKIQMSVAVGSQLNISSHLVEEAGATEKTESVVGLVRGLIRIQVTRDENEEVQQKVEANGVAFAVRGTEYEVSSNDDDAELDVMEGEVEVSSPYVQTFVPEIVKPNEGFKFERKARKFNRRAMRQRLKESHFLERQEIRRLWKTDRRAKFLERKKAKAGLKVENKQERLQTRENRRAERAQRKGNRKR